MIDQQFLKRVVGLSDFQARSRSDDVLTKPEDESYSPRLGPSIPPDEALDTAYSRLRASVEEELVDTLKRVSPRFSEEVVVDLLVRVGYRGNRAEAAGTIGRSGDGGMDGVIDGDRLGLDSIYVQAKRWDSSVGRPEIQKFAGALQGQRATKGIFITTATFTREAEDYAQRIGIRIALIDGLRLASLMFEHDVGVSPKRTYIVKNIDGDYFEDA